MDETHISSLHSAKPLLGTLIASVHALDASFDLDYVAGKLQSMLKKWLGSSIECPSGFDLVLRESTDSSGLELVRLSGRPRFSSLDPMIKRRIITAGLEIKIRTMCHSEFLLNFLSNLLTVDLRGARFVVLAVSIEEEPAAKCI